ncbi:MAG TPA: outer membrane beta-barrel protein [Rariglobus sp.]
MKNIVRNLTVLSCVGSSAFAAPFLAIGDNAELFAIADASVSYNDNILLAPSGDELDDVVSTFKPGFDLQFGKESLVKGNVIATATLTSYADNEKLNNQLLGIGSNSTYDNGQLKLAANASFNELDQATVDVVPTVGKLIERHVAAAGVNGELSFSEKISAGAGVSYNHVDYKDSNYTEQEEYTVPVNVYYELTPKVDLSAGIRYTHTELDKTGANEYDAFYYNIGARGSFTPKLSGSFSVGLNTRDTNVGPDDDASVGSDASLAYAYSDKTQFNLSLSRNFSNATAGGASYENSQITLGATSAITVDWRLNASVSYRQLDYQNVSRTDDYVEGSVGATYIINSHLNAGLSYVYRNQSSDAGAASEFDNNLVTLSLSARY